MAFKMLARVKAKEQRLTAERLRAMLHYDPETGLFTRIGTRKRRPNRAGGVGYVTPFGYLHIRINCCGMFSAHRLAWLYVYGEWPDGVIDHINGDATDNRIVNLRVATQAQNSANQGKQCRNTSGYKGVYWDKRRSKWMAQIGVQGRYKYLGRYDTAEEAHEAYREGCLRFHGEFARIE